MGQGLGEFLVNSLAFVSQAEARIREELEARMREELALQA